MSIHVLRSKTGNKSQVKRSVHQRCAGDDVASEVEMTAAEAASVADGFIIDA